MTRTSAIPTPALEPPPPVTTLPPEPHLPPFQTPESLSPDLRLVIEEDPAGHTYIYKTVNRLTGEVVQQFPREQVLRLKAERDYEPGDIVKTGA